MQKLGYHEVCRISGDLFAKEDDPVVQQAGIDIIATFPPWGLLDYVGNEGDVRRVVHGVLPFFTCGDILPHGEGIKHTF